jgi:hypothetical protein
MPGPQDQVVIDWDSIRKLAGLFDKLGDDVVTLKRASTSLGSTSGLVGGDDDGRAFAEWYNDGYDSQAGAMTRIAEKNFTWAGNLHDFKKLWDHLEQQIIATLPEIPDLPEPPIPQAPPRKVGA